MRNFRERVQIMTQSGQYVLDSQCNSYLAVNNGDTLVQVNGFPLKPPVLPTLSGESTGVVGNENEIFIGNMGVFQVTFIGAGSNPSVIIKEKFFVNENC